MTIDSNLKRHTAISIEASNEKQKEHSERGDTKTSGRCLPSFSRS